MSEKKCITRNGLHGIWIFEFPVIIPHSSALLLLTFQCEEDGQIFFSLDDGSTKFTDLIQLVEFYQLNRGVLPCRLKHPCTIVALWPDFAYKQQTNCIFFFFFWKPDKSSPLMMSSGDLPVGGAQRKVGWGWVLIFFKIMFLVLLNSAEWCHYRGIIISTLLFWLQPEMHKNLIAIGIFNCSPLLLDENLFTFLHFYLLDVFIFKFPPAGLRTVPWSWQWHSAKLSDILHLPWEIPLG